MHKAHLEQVLHSVSKSWLCPKVEAIGYSKSWNWSIYRNGVPRSENPLDPGMGRRSGIVSEEVMLGVPAGIALANRRKWSNEQREWLG